MAVTWWIVAFLCSGDRNGTNESYVGRFTDVIYVIL